MPEKVSLKTGLANLPWSFANYPRYASGIVWEEKASVLPLLFRTRLPSGLCSSRCSSSFSPPSSSVVGFRRQER